ncbi:uncharacterized protein LOC134847863 [Symsagittifera roscoffensis]|uniref:uncharacterized protein LOC134847863 n=1 Tax=Symsagittifera roscoffensis TaxID=84072 RepID=UPI00307BC483
MSVVPAVDVQKLTSADCKRLVGFYLSELRRIQAKHMEFLNQKFTFIKAVQRDHLTTGANHPCIDSVDALERVATGLRQNEWSNKIDVDVVSLLVANIHELNQIVQGFLQLYFQLRPSIRYDLSSSDRDADQLKNFMSPHTNVLSLARRFQLHLNDREEDQVGGILNLIPYMVQTAADVTTAISAHSHDLEQAEIEEMKRAQQKPPTPAPVVQPRTPVQTCDANSQVMGKEIFQASRAKDSGTQLSAEDWRKMQIQEKNRNYVYGLGHFPPFAVDN